MSKVFGIGWAKTGTTTLGECFQILGYDHQSQRLDLVPDLKIGNLTRIMQVAAEKTSFEDWPWIILFEQLDCMFQGSKFVLTVREPRSWLRSYSNMLRLEGEAPAETNETRRVLYGLPFPNVTDGQLLARYQNHNHEVQEYFARRTNDLLVVNWEAGDGWQRLAAFLNKEIPRVPFPHENKGVYDDVSA